VFGDDTFERSLSTCLEQVSTVTIKLIAKLNTALVIGSKQMLQALSTLYERLLAKVLAIEVQEIKRIKDNAVGSLSHGGG
jgi:hypothetical protein